MLKYKVVLIRINSNGVEIKEKVDLEFDSKYSAKKWANNRLNRDAFVDDYEIIPVK